MQVQYSYEEKIMNALDRIGVQKRNEHFLEYDKRRFDAIRAILQPLYEQVEAAGGGDSDGD